MPYKKRRKTKEPDSDLGFLATRFAHHLDCGLQIFEEEFSDFHPHYIQHADHGKGLLFSQLKEKDYGIETAAAHSVIAFEQGIMWSSGETICYNNEQTPERVALLFLCAMTHEQPISTDHIKCENCRMKENDE